MSYYMVLSLPVEGMENYTSHPDFTAGNILETTLSLIQESSTTLEITTKWFDVWDMIMSWMAMRTCIDDPTLSPELVGMVRGTIRGTVLNHSDVVTDLSNYVTECARLNFAVWKPIMQLQPQGTPFRVLEVTPTGILIEVLHEQQVA